MTMAVKTKDKPKLKPKSDTAQWVEDAAKHAGLKYAALGRLLNERLQKNFDRSMPSKMAAGQRQVTAEEMIAIAELTGFALPDALIPRSLSGRDKVPSTTPTTVRHHSDVNLPEQSIDHMPLWNRGDGYRIDEPHLVKDDARLVAFLSPYLTGVAQNKYEIWRLMSAVIDSGPCKAGSYLVVEIGRQPNPKAYVLAFCNDKKLPRFRVWMGPNLLAAPLIPAAEYPDFIDGRDANVAGVVLKCWPEP